jgi:Arc/MetJ-type ribon-helix-helix transcriptional regulator
MRKSIKVHQKKKIGRPATGRDPAVTVRLPPSVLDQVEDWAKQQDDQPKRSPAIRRLVELGLTVKMKAKQPSAGRANRAKELATKTIEKIIDPSAPPEERAQRRRRLTKGPSEFREDRVDLPKVKTK